MQTLVSWRQATSSCGPRHHRQHHHHGMQAQSVKPVQSATLVSSFFPHLLRGSAERPVEDASLRHSGYLARDDPALLPMARSRVATVLQVHERQSDAAAHTLRSHNGQPWGEVCRERLPHALGPFAAETGCGRNVIVRPSDDTQFARFLPAMSI